MIDIVSEKPAPHLGGPASTPPDLKPVSVSRRLSALGFDFFFLFLNTQFFILFFRAQPRFEIFTVALVPLLLLPVYLYLSSRYLRQSFGQYVNGIERVRRGSYAPITRVYDWSLDSELRMKGPTAFQGPWLGPLCLIGTLCLSAGVSMILATSDPMTKRWKSADVPLDEALLKNTSLTYLPFAYLLTPIPASFENDPILWELPYLKGPPKSFVGRVELQWSEEWQNRMAFSGPLSFPRTVKVSDLVDCLGRFFGCGADRHELLQKHLKLRSDFNEIFETAIWRIENPLLKPEERPIALYVRGTSAKDPKRLREVALILNGNLALQTVSLDQKISPLNEKNSAFFRSVISNIRMTGDLAASRAWVNAKLAEFQPSGEPTIPQISEAEKLLLSKLSVDPTQLEPFYHLFRFSELEYRRSLAAKNLVSTARARRLMSALVQYARDIAPADQKSKEMEQTLAQIERGT